MIASPTYSAPAQGLAAPPAGLDLSPVYRRCVFRSAIRSRSHQPLCDSLNEHEVQWGRGDADSVMFRADTPRLQVMVLKYGSEVEVRPRPFEDFSLVQMPLRGSMAVECEGVHHLVGVGEVAVLSSQRALTLKWSEDCEQIIVRMPHSLLRSGVSSVKEFVRLPGADPVHMLDGDGVKQWEALLQSLLNTMPTDDGKIQPLSDPAWVHHLEEGMALFTMLHLRHVSQNAGDGRTIVEAPGAVTSNGSAARLRTAEIWVKARLCAPLALEDLAKAAGVSSRTFYMDCMRQMGIGPMTWLRGLRLDSARRRLLENPNKNVTDVATDCGFGHLGRFSAYYQRRFGELPRETVSRSGG